MILAKHSLNQGMDGSCLGKLMNNAGICHDFVHYSTVNFLKVRNKAALVNCLRLRLNLIKEISSQK